MKKYILSFIFSFMFGTMFADTFKANCTVVPARESMLLQNNSKKTYIQDPYITFSITLDGSKINFNVFEKVVIDDKTFIIGNGSNNVNCICVYDNKICIPVSNYKKIMIESNKLSSYILNAVEDVPASDSF